MWKPDDPQSFTTVMLPMLINLHHQGPHTRLHRAYIWSSWSEARLEIKTRMNSQNNNCHKRLEDLTSHSQSKQPRSCRGRSLWGLRKASLDHLCRRGLPRPGLSSCPPVHSRAWPGPGRQLRDQISAGRLKVKQDDIIQATRTCTCWSTAASMA